MSTSYAQAKRVQNLHLTRERDRRRGRELATFLLAGLPIACALLAYAAYWLWNRTADVVVDQLGKPDEGTGQKLEHTDGGV